MKTLAKCLMISLFFAVTGAHAGAKFTNYVSIGTSDFRGSLEAARNSADTTQYIGCYISAYSSSQSVHCQARNSAGTSKSCVNSSPTTAMLNAVATLSDAAYVYVQVSGSTCTRILSHSNSAFMQ